MRVGLSFSLSLGLRSVWSETVVVLYIKPQHPAWCPSCAVDTTVPEPLLAQALTALTLLLSVAVFADRPRFKSLCDLQMATAPISMEHCATPSLQAPWPDDG